MIAGPDRGRSVGIVGAGPAGLAAAERLRELGYAVTVYDRHDRPGAMFKLSRAHPGQQITVTQAGERHRFNVVEKTTLDRRRQLPDRFFTTTGRHRLVLISCTDRVVTAGGHFHYTKYVVIVARPVKDQG